MSIVLIFSSILMGLGVALWFYDRDIGYSIISLALFFGFGVFSMLVPVDSTKIQVENFNVIHDDYRTIISTPTHIKSFEEMSYKDLKKDDITVFIKQPINSYGLEPFPEKLEIEFKEN